MKKIRVNANAIVDDNRMGLDLKSLMEKHGLSYRHLLKVQGRLQEKGWITAGRSRALEFGGRFRAKYSSGQRISGLFSKPT